MLWRWQTPPAGLLFTLVMMGGIASAGQLLLTRAYVHAPAAWVGSFTYTIVPLAALIGWWGWDEKLDALSLFGGLLVVCGALMVLHLGPNKPRAECRRER
jgi:drug/metabolite transporter (DMT)-like permease